MFQEDLIRTSKVDVSKRKELTINENFEASKNEEKQNGLKNLSTKRP